MAHTILRTRKAPADLVSTLLRTRSYSSEATTYGKPSKMSSVRFHLHVISLSGIKMESLAQKEFEDKTFCTGYRGTTQFPLNHYHDKQITITKIGEAITAVVFLSFIFNISIYLFYL